MKCWFKARDYPQEPQQLLKYIDENNYLTQPEVNFEDLKSLENRIEKWMKTQAEDIAMDVTDLEKQIKRANMKLTTLSKEDFITRKDLEKFKSYFTNKMEEKL